MLIGECFSQFHEMEITSHAQHNRELRDPKLHDARDGGRLRLAAFGLALATAARDGV